MTTTQTASEQITARSVTCTATASCTAAFRRPSGTSSTTRADRLPPNLPGQAGRRGAQDRDRRRHLDVIELLRLNYDRAIATTACRRPHSQASARRGYRGQPDSPSRVVDARHPLRRGPAPEEVDRDAEGDDVATGGAKWRSSPTGHRPNPLSAKKPHWGRNLPHYHRRSGIGKHRPWEGGF